MSGGHIALRLWDGLKDLEVEAQLLVNTENGGNVAAAVAVVRGGPDGDQVLVREHELVALLNQLVSAAYQGKIVNVGELGVDQRRVCQSPFLKKLDRKERVTSDVTLLPKTHPAPRGLTAQVSMSSGSDHIRSGG